MKSNLLYLSLYECRYMHQYTIWGSWHLMLTEHCMLMVLTWIMIMRWSITSWLSWNVRCVSVLIHFSEIVPAVSHWGWISMALYIWGSSVIRKVFMTPESTIICKLDYKCITGSLKYRWDTGLCEMTSHNESLLYIETCFSLLDRICEKHITWSRHLNPTVTAYKLEIKLWSKILCRLTELRTLAKQNRRRNLQMRVSFSSLPIIL